MGAPRGNVNALKRGRRTDRHGLALAYLGKRHEWAYRQVVSFRRRLEALAPAAQGAAAMRRDALIDECAKWELAARLIYKAIAAAGDLPPGELVSNLNAASHAVSRRNACLNRLLGDAPAAHQSPWDVLDAMQAAARHPRPETTTSAPEPPASGSGAEEN